MDFLRSQIARIQQQLAGLNASQKMLAGSLAVIAAMTVLWWISYAGRAEMEPVLDQAMSSEDIALITRQLASKGITYQVAGDRILVPTDRKMEALADLSYSQVLPHDTSSAFDQIISKASPFAGNRTNEVMFNQIKQVTLAEVIRGWEGVSHAMVLIDPTRERGPNGVDPTATVNITTRSRANGDAARFANSAAALLTGAVAKLQREHITIIVDGVARRITGSGNTLGAGGEAWLEQVETAERYNVEKVYKLLGWIDGVMVSVSVTPNNVQKEVVDHAVDKSNTVSQLVTEEKTTEENRSAAKASDEVGLVSNAPLAAGGAGGVGGDTTSGTNEHEKNGFFVDHSHKDTKSISPGGELPVTSASIAVPRSYFVQVFQRRTNSGSKDPDPIALQTLIDTELLNIKSSVKGCLGDVKDDAIHMVEYTDLMPIAATAPQAASTSLPLALTGHVKEISLGALALVSLFMVSHMVKKGAPAPVMSAPVALRPTIPLGGVEEAVGEASEGQTLLDGMELDEDAVKAQQILGQVSEMVGENPDIAANMVKRWLNRA